VTQNLLLALQITAIGMSLVFGSIILFWLVMAALVRLSNLGHTRPAGTERSPNEKPRQTNLQEGSAGRDLPPSATEGLPAEIAQHLDGEASRPKGVDQREWQALLKRRAAVAAVAVALARRADAAQLPAHSPEAPPAAQVSAWQAVHRANRLRTHNHSRGLVR
jgi:Na+-transporting methylmalonyl-CoA/oxaloacetate decarboxylase gamma subunit